jgi:hypothetical protein
VRGLPEGLEFKESTRTFRGKLSKFEDVKITVEAVDPHGASVQQEFSFNV